MNKKKVVFYVLMGLFLGLFASFCVAVAKEADTAKAGVTAIVLMAAGTFCLTVFTGILITALDNYKKLISHPIEWSPIINKFLYWIIPFIGGLILGPNLVWGRRAIDITQAGTAFWVFVVIGTILILLQLIPAIIVFVAIMSRVTKIIHEKIPIKATDESFFFREKVKVPQKSDNGGKPSG